MSDTVIVLRDNCILAAEGKAGKMPKLSRVVRIPADGFGDPFEEWKKALIEYKNKYAPTESVRIILPTAQSSSRMTQIPYATGKQLRKIAQNVAIKSAGEGIVDYAVTQGDKKNGICLCCGSATEDVLNSVVEMCSEVKLSIRSISVPIEGYLRALANKKEFRQKTAIFLLFEENSVTSVLYKDGIYHYSTRSRIFSERGTFDFGTEIVRSISGVLQFYSTIKDAKPITDVYYTGCDKDDFEVCIEGIQNMNLQVQPFATETTFTAEGNVEDWFICFGALFQDKSKSLNLYQALKAKNKDAEIAEKQTVFEYIKYPLIVFGVCAVVFSGISVWNLLENNKISDINDWINDDTVQEQYKIATEKEEESDALTQSQDQVDKMEENLATYPELTSEMIAEIINASGGNVTVQIRAIDEETGVMEFHVSSSEVLNASAYVKTLTQTELFSEVNYTGYSYDDSSNVYTLTLSCVLKSAAEEAKTEREETQSAQEGGTQAQEIQTDGTQTNDAQTDSEQTSDAQTGGTQTGTVQSQETTASAGGEE